MKFSFLRLITGRDSFGHPINLFYKGEETHQSLLGGIITILIQATTLILLFSSIMEVFEMEEPQVTSYERPIFPDEREERGVFDLNELGFVIAFDTHIIESGMDSADEVVTKHTPLDPMIGTINAYCARDDLKDKLEE